MTFLKMSSFKISGEGGSADRFGVSLVFRYLGKSGGIADSQGTAKKRKGPRFGGGEKEKVLL